MTERDLWTVCFHRGNGWLLEGNITVWANSLDDAVSLVRSLIPTLPPLASVYRGKPEEE